MNRDDIIHMAQQCWPSGPKDIWAADMHLPRLERFAALVAAAEREACAVAAKEFLQDGSGHGEFLGNLLAQHIRERGEKA